MMLAIFRIQGVGTAECGPRAALLSKLPIAFGFMSTGLYFSNHHRLDGYTGLFAGLLVATYITLEAPLSGMSMNPARTPSLVFCPHAFDFTPITDSQAEA
jgi:aquaporin Z